MDTGINDAINSVLAKLSTWLDQLILILPNLAVAVLILFLFYLLGKLIRNFVKKPLQKSGTSQTISNLLLNILFIIILALGIFIALSVLKLDGAVASLLAGAGIVGLALGFAFQDIAANFISGVLMAIRKPIEVGDIIESDDHFGKVIDINLRCTIIRTPQGQHVYIPNKDVYGDSMINYSDEPNQRIDLSCGVSYGDDLEKAEKLAIEAVESIDYIDHEEGITLFYTEFGDSSINFVIRYWVEYNSPMDYRRAMSDGIKRITKIYDENDIMIPFPIRTLDFGIRGGEQLHEHLGRSQ